MTTPNISISPMAMSNGAGLFQLQSGGFVQGFMQPDPAARYQLAQGVLASTETLPMIPGAAIKVNVPAGILGGNVARATTSATIAGFTVSNQAYNAILTQSAPVPTQGTSMSVQYVLLGSGARLAVGISADLAAALGAGSSSVSTQVSWDFAKQQLVPYAPAYSDVTITNAVWASTSGGQTTFTVGTDLTAVLSAGDVVEVTGVVSTGGTGVGFNGEFVVVSVTSTTIVVTQAAASSPGTYSSGGTVLAGGGAVACKILAVNAGNSMQVYADADGVYQWNINGNCALIQI